MKRTKFMFRDSYQQAIDLIDDKATKMELLMAITDYGMKGEVYTGDNKIVLMAMALIMPQIDKENRRYEIKEEQPAATEELIDTIAPKESKELKDISRQPQLNSPKPPKPYNKIHPAQLRL